MHSRRMHASQSLTSPYFRLVETVCLQPSHGVIESRASRDVVDGVIAVTSI
jgi:hypothetical protein